MNTNPPQSHFLKFLSTHTVIPFLVSFIVSAGFVPQLSADIKADRLKASGSRQVEAGGNILGQPLKGKASSAPVKDFRNHASIGKELAGPAAFATGIDSGAQWSRWNQRPVDSTYDSLAGFKQITHAPAFTARNLKEISADPEDDAVLLDQKMTTLVEDILGNVRVVEQKADVLSAATANGMMQAVDNTYQVTDKVYQDIDGMYQEIGGLRTALDNNYERFAQYDDPGPEIIQQFNAASDAMAERVGEMIRAIEAMANKITADMQKSGGMVTSLDHMEKDGVAAVQYSDVLQVRIDEAARQYKLIDTALREKAGILVHPSGDVAGLFREQQDYLKSLKKYINSDEISRLGGVRKYITDGQSYLQKVLADLQLTKLNLQKEEEYFRKAKVGAVQSRDIEVAPAEGENVCAQSEVKGLSSLKECAKSCRRVCRWKEKVGGNDCYECPSGSPDSCFDVGGLPANHPWCESGGICHSDPMMYCSPFGAVGPQGEKLQCTNCKQRPDLCWQKVGGGMTWTNCKMGCWNGKCVFKGKYQEFEWDGSPEWIHCFECKTPPPPPTCEELGWGFDWKSDCEKTCPAPGYCEEVTMPSGKPKAPQPPKAPGEDGKPDEGQQDGGQQDGGQPGGGTGSDSGGEGESGPGGGGKANPPTDGTAEQPGGGGEMAGGQGQQPITDGPAEPEGQGEQPQKPDNPGTTAPTQPEKPKTDKPDVTDGNPPQPPDPPAGEAGNSQIRWLRTRIAQTTERIKDREEIVNDPREGDYVKTSAASQLDAYNKELERLKKELKEEEDKELERQRKAAEEKARSEEAARERDRTRTRWPSASLRGEPDPKVEMQKIRLKELKESIDALKKRAEEIRDALTGRKDHIDRLTHEIDLLEREIKFHKETGESDSDHATRAKETIPELEKQLAHKKNLRNVLMQGMQEAQKQYAAELEALKRTYQKKLYAADENARRQEETKRIDEYYDLFMELEHTKASRDERNRAFEEKFKDMESQIAAAKANGDDDTAEKLQEQLDNMKRGKEAWDKQYESQIKNLEDRLFETGHHRNFDDGVGPINKDGLIDKLNEYGKIMDNEIAATEKKISQLQSGSTMTREQSQQLEALKARMDQLRAAREGITEKQNVLKSGYKLPEDIAANIQNSTNRYAEGSKNQGPDKSFAQLFAESLAEESVHNLNPLVAAKKSVAFGWGVAKGVGTAVKGLAELGIGAVDLTMEMYLTDLGFDIETDALDSLNNMISTIGSNANFDGVIKAVVAAGGAIDAKLKKLEKSGDIDWATAEAGGEVAGEFVVADVVIAGAVGKASKFITGADEAAEAARLAGKLDDAADASKVAGKADGATDIGRTAGKVADDAPTGSVASKVNDVPTPKPHETPPTRGPPEARPYNNKNPLPTNTRPTTQLGDDVLEGIEKNQGFRKDHAQRMNEFAQEHDAFLLVRDGNPDSVKFFDDPDLMPKPMSSKAKTAKVGPNQGLVVDPTHPKQTQYWDDAIAEAKKTDPAHAAWLEKQRGKALDSWNDYGDYMKDHGYRVNPDSGVIEYVEKLPDGTDKVWKGVHGDYDLHGVYRKAPDGTMESVSFGSGQKFGPNGLDVEGGALRQQLNDKLSGGKKDFIQHGGQDDWVPDPNKIPNKPPDPPVTVFFPDGRPPVRLGDAKAMKAFYEGEMGVKWPYPDPK